MIPAIQEVNFPPYATLHQATVSLQDMGDRVISTQVRIDGDVVPDFSGWELKFKGERFVLPSDNPQASKDNTTRNSIVDLQFQSWVIQELKRYYFFEAASVSAGVAIADKYVTPVRLNVEDFVAMLNQVLKYYFGDTVVADLYMSGQSQYSTEPKVIDINYSYLWDVIGQIYEIYGVRYRIVYNSTTGVYTIKFGWPTTDIDITDHDFEYGYKGGLLKFERQVQDETITNILLGRGGEKNLPYRYFKKVDPQNPTWAADPDAIPELKNIYFDRLRDINFRWYVRGWMHNPNRDTSGDEAWDPGHVFPTYEISSDSPYYWAYYKGLVEDMQFNPVEFVKDDASIEAYGERWGAADDNDEIYPTIQGRSRNPIGRIDEVVAVSPIVTDDIEAMAAASAVEKSIDRMVVTSPSSNPYTIDSDWFEIPTGQTGNIRYAWVGPTEGSSVTHIATDQSSIVAIDANGTEHPISGLSAGRYKLHLSLKLHVPDGYTTAGQWGLENIVLTTSAQDANAWKPTFDIWVKNIWGTQFRDSSHPSESPEEYAARVWEEILGDRAGNEAKVVFSTGFMSVSEDYEFVIASYPVYDTSKNINGVPSEWRITLRKSDAEYEATGLYIPNATTGGKPVAGDKFFFTGIDMPFLYVTLGEEDLNTNKSSQLEGLSVVNPTWVISLDKVRVHTLEDGEYGQTLADRLAAGAKLRVTDPRFSGGDILTLYAQSITYTWNEPSENSPYIVPDIEVVLSDKVVSRQSRADKMESSIQEIRSNYARLDDVERVVRSVAEPMFLKKTGEADSSDSPTQFSSKVSSKGFRQGGVGGNGWGFYRDNTKEVAEGEEGEGDSVLEIDRIVVRKELEVNSLVVSQAEYRGGREIQSAAQIECTKVVVDDSGKYVCYFDQKQGSVKNLFVVGDFAYSTEFAPDNTVVKYYRRRVDAVDVDRIVLSDTVKDGAGVPAAGDVIIQYGHESNTARQYVIVRDVIDGGYERMISGLSTVSTNGKEYYFAGRQTGQYYDKPRWFVGDSDGEYAEYLNGILNIKGRLQVLGESGSYSDLGYLADALPKKGSTLIQGGLILTSMIQLGQVENSTFKVYSGINGKIDTSLEDPLETIAAWYGGPMVDHEASPSEANYAKSLFRMNGSGYLAGGNIHWDENGYGGIPGITWSRPSGSQNDVITIGADVMLESTGGADSRVTDLITLVRSLSNMFDDESYTEGGQTKHRIKVKSGFEGLYTNGYLSAGGVSSGGGSSAVDLQAVWASLEGNTGYGANRVIDTHHIPVATSDAVGGIKIGYEENGRNYAVKLSDGKAYVTIPWVDQEPIDPLADAIGDVKTAVKGIGESIVDLSMNVDGLHAGLMELADEDLALLGRIETLADYFDASGNAKSALKLTTTGPLNIWGVQYWNDGIPNAVTGQPYLYIAQTRVKTSAANDTLLGINGWTNTGSASTTGDKSKVEWDSDNDAWHFIGNVYADGWVSAGGLSSGGGQAAGNASLSNVTTLAHGQTGELSASSVGTLVLYDKDAIDYMIENAGQVKKVAGVDPDSLGNVPVAGLSTALGLGDAAGYGVASSVTQNDTTHLVTGAAVWAAIDALPEPMIFKGSLGTGGTITTLPTASSANDGYTYKVITAGTYAGHAAKIGDLFISNGSSWIWIPSGDEPEGTVTSVGISLPTGLKLGSGSASPITTSGTFNIVFDTGYSIPTDANQSAWTAKYDKPSGGIPNTDLAHSSITIGSTSISLGGTSSVLAGLTSVTSQKFYLNANTYFELDSDGYVHLVTPTGKGFYTEGFISAGGLSTGGGATGATLEAVWKTLINDSSDHTYDSTLIDGAHIPDMASAYGYIKSVSLAEGATNGTIHIVVDGTAGSDVAVHGLGTAAYANTTAFAAATHSHTISQITDFPASLKNPYALTFGNKTYDGSAEVSLSASDLGALTSVPAATNDAFGGFKTGYAESLENYAVQLSSGKAYVHIADSIPYADAIGDVKTAIKGLGETIADLSMDIDTINALLSQPTIEAIEFKLVGGEPVMVWDEENKAWHLTGNFYADGFVSAGGVSSGSGSSGIDEAAMWAALQRNSGEGENKQIHNKHLPTCGTGLSYTLDEDGIATAINVSFPVTSVAGKTGAVTLAVEDITDFPTTWSWENITDAPSTMPNPAALTFGTKAYDGSVAKTITASDLGALTSVAFSDLTSHPTNLSGYGITDAQPLDDDLTAIAELTGTSGFLKKTAANTWTLDTNTYLTASTVPVATSSAYGGIKLGYTESREHYAVQLSSGKAYVNVPDSIPYSDALGDIKSAIKGLDEQMMDLSMDIDSINALLSNPTIEALEFKLFGGAPVMTWDEANQAWHLNGNFYADGFVSAGGMSDGGGSQGIDPAAMWAYLKNTSSDHTYDSELIATAHIPDMASTYGYIKSVSLSSGTSNGTLRISVDGVSSSDVAVTGLGNAAYRGIASTIGSSVNDLVSGSLLYGVLGDAFDATNTVKAFVNSSIATATATFRGTNTTATTEAAFLTWANALTKTLNDYVFWKTMDSAGNVVFKRYKYGYDGTEAGSLAWRYEYDLNNSSFTAAQWSAINSGITATKVGNYDTIAGYFTNGLLQASHVGDLSGTYVVKGGLSTADGTIATWGTLTAANGYSAGMHWSSSDGGDATISYKGGQISMQVDGYFYQNEGAYRVADTSDLAKYLLLTGGTMTGALTLKANQYSGLSGYGMNANNSDIVNLNAIYTADLADDASEGINFYRSSGRWDSLTSSNGVLYYYPNRADGTTAFSGAYTIYHSGNSNKSDVAWACSTLNATTSVTCSSVEIGNSNEINSLNNARLHLNYRSTGDVTLAYGGGNVGIGTTAPAYKLDVAGVIYASTGIYSDGYVSAGGLSSSSDERLKTAIKDFKYSKDLLMSIRPREWDWNGKAAMKGHAAGFVAQEIEPLIPYAVDNAMEYKALFYDQFHAIEIAGLQDHERRIRELENAVKARDKKIDELEKRLKSRN